MKTKTKSKIKTKFLGEEELTVQETVENEHASVEVGTKLGNYIFH